MRRFTIFGVLLFAFAFIGATGLQAQTVVQTWDFESGIGDWVSGADAATVSVSTDQAQSGSNSAKLVGANNTLEINFQNDAFEDMQEGDTYSMSIYVSSADMADINGFQLFWQNSASWTWNSQWINGGDITADQWNEVSVTIPAMAAPLQRIGFQLLLSTGNEAKTPTLYVDDVKVSRPAAPAGPMAISDWGAIGTRLASSGWSLDATGSGSYTVSGPGSTSANWTAVRGAFADTVDLTVGDVLTVRGSFEIDGSLEGWNPIRVGVYDHRDTGTLHYAGTDSAAWGYTQYAGTDSAAFVSNESQAYGYLVTSQVGANGGIGGQGGNNTVWAVNGGSWISTWSGGTMGIGETVQSPRRAIMPAGTYDFEFSVALTSDTTSDFSWYIINQDEASYLQSGTHTNNFMYVGTDSSTAITSFNGFAFSHQGGDDATVMEVDFSGVEYEVGTTPITIPEPIFSSFYIDQWGAIGTRLDASGWSLDNDTTTLVGDAFLSGPGSTSGNWSAIRGGFGSLPVTATLDEAVIITGELEIDGDLTGWNPLRFGMFNHTDAGNLVNQYTDSAAWGYTQYAGTDSAAFNSNESSAYGYLITSQVGANGGIGGQGGNGSAWAVNGGSWISTWSGGSIQIGETLQSPRRANMVAGTYEFAMSAQPLSDGTTEFRWYIIDEDGENYLQSGIHHDTTAQKTVFNGFVFSHQGGDDATVTEINILAVEVDRGAPIEIPAPIFSSFYADTWGFVGDAFGGSSATDSAWALTPGVLVGDVSFGGAAATGWANVAADFGIPVTPKAGEAIEVTADITFEGGGFDAGSFKIGIFGDANLGGRDSTEKVGYVFTGSDTVSGYVVTPTASSSTIGYVNDGPWYEADGSVSDHTAAGTTAAGTYELTLVVGPASGGGVWVAAKLEGEDGFKYEVDAVDANGTLASYTAIILGTNSSSVTEVVVEAMEIDIVPASEVAIDIENQDTGLPTVFNISQNYPNPFNPTTQIEFAVPQTSNVTLKVYDVMGRLVQTLVDGNRSAGTYSVTFNANNLASGVYFYRMEAGSFVQMKQMMLIK